MCEFCLNMCEAICCSIELKFPNSNHAFRYYIWYESAYYLISASMDFSHVELFHRNNIASG